MPKPDKRGSITAIMRLSSELWVAAYLRASAARGVPAMLVRRGDPDTGSIYIKVARLDGTALLFGPPPMGHVSGSAEAQDAARWFMAWPKPGPLVEREIDSYLAEQWAFDSDLWIVEAEDRQGRHGLDEWLVD